MIIVLKVLAVVIIGYVLAGVFYGSLIGVCILLEKCGGSKGKIVAEFAIGTILTFCVSHIIGERQYQLRNLDDLSIYAVAALTVLVTIFIVLKIWRPYKTSKEMLLSGLDAVAMEIVQRLMMQPFVYWLLLRFGVTHAELLAILITAIIWCMGILTQQLMQKEVFDKNFGMEMLASFVFSFGIGYVFQKSGFILLTMLAHGMERVLSAALNNRRYGR